MTATLYLWLLGVVLAVAGGALMSRGWWLDKAAGNHKRARCRKCWYELGATAPNTEGVTVCPECGTQARRSKELHRVRRNGWVVVAGVVLVGGGVFLAGRPVMNGGNWLYLLPRWAAARLWKPVGAEGYGQQLKWRVANGTATEAEIASVAEGAKETLLQALKARMGTKVQELESALQALSRQPPDPEVDAAVAAVLVQGPFNARSAVQYFEMQQVPMERRVELCRAAMKAAPPVSSPTGYFDMLGKAKNDPAALREVVRLAASGTQWAGFVRHYVDENGDQAMLAIAEQYRGSKDPAERTRLARLFHDAFRYKGTGAVTAFVLELCDDPIDNEIGLRILESNSDRLNIPDEKVKEWVLGSDTARRDYVLNMVGCRARRKLPEGCGAAVIRLWDAGQSLPCSLASRFSGADRLLWLERVEKGTLERRRAACSIVAEMQALPEFEAALRRIEADPKEAEEMRVAARDALKRMRLWIEPVGQRAR